MRGEEASEPEMMRTPVKLEHVLRRSASAWELIVQYGSPSSSHGGGILSVGQSARTNGPGLFFSLVVQ
jgi:hypothetical protein